MATAISFAEGGIVNQTSGALNALRACDCSHLVAPVSTSVCARGHIHAHVFGHARPVIKRKCRACEKKMEKREIRGSTGCGKADCRNFHECTHFAIGGYLLRKLKIVDIKRRLQIIRELCARKLVFS